MIANILSIAGSDPSGGAGIQADLKTFGALGCYGMAVITALTAQNTQGVSAVHIPPPEFVAAQIDSIFADIRVDAVKIGMLANGTIARVVAERLRHHSAENIVLDPVLVATSGDSLGSPDVVEAMLKALFPLATLVTPNLPEAARLTGSGLPLNRADMEACARTLLGIGAKAVLVKGGHLPGELAADLLAHAAENRWFEAPRIATKNTHGTGCTLAAAIAANLGKGLELAAAVSIAKTYLSGALAYGSALDVGRGNGPVNHFFARTMAAAKMPTPAKPSRAPPSSAPIPANPTADAKRPADPEAAFARSIEDLIRQLKTGG